MSRRRHRARRVVPNGSAAHIQALYQAARAAVPREYGDDPDVALRIRPWLRKVQEKFDELLKTAGVEVEGLR